jgi:hypothetical protein
MAKYAVKIIETLARTVIVEAESFDDAVSKVEEGYDKADIILTADDFEGNEFEISNTFGEDKIDECDPRLEFFEKYPSPEEE